MSELSFIKNIRKQLSQNSQVILGPGDDCAVLPKRHSEQLVTTDTLMDGSHFLCKEHDPELIGRKALAVSLSDIASMGGVPEVAFVSLCMPKSSLAEGFCESVMTGIIKLANDYEVAIGGGDSNSWNGPLVVSITLTGRPHSKGIIYRSGAKKDDVIVVSGPLGGSIEGHHLTFTPRVSLVKQLQEVTSPNAMIDVSDGIGSDLRHICRESNVSATLCSRDIPIRDNIKNLPTEEAVNRALSDGEDFELCFTLSAEAWETLQTSSLKEQFVKIGTINSKSDHELYWDDGSVIEQKGFEHKF